jgi:hypothetical protein
VGCERKKKKAAKDKEALGSDHIYIIYTHGEKKWTLDALVFLE